jgi:RNA polymerase subunit RPABC4/transcription elongation factor Spt4
MAIRACDECGRKFSTTSKESCPNCRAPFTAAFASYFKQLALEKEKEKTEKA